jgi:hypothetical protein
MRLQRLQCLKLRANCPRTILRPSRRTSVLSSELQTGSRRRLYRATPMGQGGWARHRVRELLEFGGLVKAFQHYERKSESPWR